MYSDLEYILTKKHTTIVTHYPYVILNGTGPTAQQQY